MDDTDPGQLLVAIDNPEIADIAPWVVAHVQATQQRLVEELAADGIVFVEGAARVQPELVQRLRLAMLTAMQGAFDGEQPSVAVPPAPPPPMPEAQPQATPPPPQPEPAGVSPELVKQLADGIAQALSQSYAPAPMSPAPQQQYSPPAGREKNSSSRYPLGAFLASGGA